MKRPLLLIGLAIAVILAGLFIANWINSRSLATATVRSASGVVTDFRIWRENDNIYVSARERRGLLENGRFTIRLLGDTGSLEAQPASITLNDRKQEVILRAGGNLARFDLVSQQMAAPEREGEPGA